MPAVTPIRTLINSALTTLRHSSVSLYQMFMLLATSLMSLESIADVEIFLLKMTEASDLTSALAGHSGFRILIIRSV